MHKATAISGPRSNCITLNTEKHKGSNIVAKPTKQMHCHKSVWKTKQSQIFSIETKFSGSSFQLAEHTEDLVLSSTKHLELSSKLGSIFISLHAFKSTLRAACRRLAGDKQRRSEETLQSLIECIFFNNTTHTLFPGSLATIRNFADKIDSIAPLFSWKSTIYMKSRFTSTIKSRQKKWINTPLEEILC